MTIYEVSDELQVLEDYYNKKYNGTQVTQIHHRYENISKDTFKLMLIETMNFSRYLPLIPDLNVALNNVRQTHKYEDNFEKVKCDKCGGSGYVVITKVVKDGGEKYKYQYGFRCTCANGQHQTDSVPTYAEVGIDENYFRR